MADATKRSLQGRSATEFFTLYACKNVVITTICLGSYLCMRPEASRSDEFLKKKWRGYTPLTQKAGQPSEWLS